MNRYNSSSAVTEYLKVLRKEIKNFEDDSEIPFYTWVMEYTKATNALSMSDADSLRLMPLFFKDFVYDKYLEVTKACQQPLRWNEVVQKLQIRFKDNFRISNARDDLMSMHQLTESVQDFANKVRSKSQYAYQGCSQTEIEQTAIRYFLRGLRREIRSDVCLITSTTGNYPISMQQATIIALNIECLVLKEKQESLQHAEKVHMVKLENEFSRMKTELSEENDQSDTENESDDSQTGSDTDEESDTDGDDEDYTSDQESVESSEDKDQTSEHESDSPNRLCDSNDYSGHDLTDDCGSHDQSSTNHQYYCCNCPASFDDGVHTLIGEFIENVKKNHVIQENGREPFPLPRKYSTRTSKQEQIMCVTGDHLEGCLYIVIVFINSSVESRDETRTGVVAFVQQMQKLLRGSILMNDLKVLAK